MHHRRARPTLRLLREDLSADWGSPRPLRLIAAERVRDLHPLSELPHPIIVKAVSAFGEDARDDNFVGPISCVTEMRLLEVKQSQWRGGVWEDPATGVCWLLVAGIAKGGHEDHDDFYQRLEREQSAGSSGRWLPTDSDLRLLKQETAARIRTQWELHVQRATRDILAVVHKGGTERIEINHPVPDRGRMAYVEVTVAPIRDDDYDVDEILVELFPEKCYVGGNLLWQLTVRLLVSIEPPEQGWDRFGDTYTNIGTPGAWSERLRSLGELVQRDELAVSESGTSSHFAHREHLAGKTISGEAVRGLCGVYFVPRQDHDSLQPCATCQERLAELPAE